MRTWPSSSRAARAGHRLGAGRGTVRVAGAGPAAPRYPVAETCKSTYLPHQAHQLAVTKETTLCTKQISNVDIFTFLEQDGGFGG